MNTVRKTSLTKLSYFESEETELQRVKIIFSQSVVQLVKRSLETQLTDPYPEGFCIMSKFWRLMPYITKIKDIHT